MGLLLLGCILPHMSGQKINLLISMLSPWTDLILYKAQLLVLITAVDSVSNEVICLDVSS